MEWIIKLNSENQVDLSVLSLIVSSLHGATKKVEAKKEEPAKIKPVEAAPPKEVKKPTKAALPKKEKSAPKKPQIEISEDSLKTMSLEGLMQASLALDDIPPVVVKQICKLFSVKYSVDAVRDIIHAFDKRLVDELTGEERKDLVQQLKVFNETDRVKNADSF